MLGPLLFLVYINDIDQGVVSKLYKLADDTIFGAKVGDTFGVEDLRADLKSGLWNGKCYSMSINAPLCT